MKFYFKMSESDKRKQAIKNGRKPAEITLYRESPRILNDFLTNDMSDWWPVWEHGTFSTEPGEFKDAREATEEYYANEAEDIYCWMHDC